MKNIVLVQIDQVTKRLAGKDIALEVSTEVIEYLAKEGYNPQYGARPLKRLIQDKILTPVASFMLTQGLNRGGTVSVSMKGSEFVFDTKKGKKSPLKIHAVKKEEEKVEN